MEGFTVTDTRQVQSMTPGGAPRTVYRVSGTTDRGASGTIEVDAENWTADNLAAILAEFRDELNLAFDLNG
jgi:hypothetical protein